MVYALKRGFYALKKVKRKAKEDFYSSEEGLMHRKES